MDARFHLEHCGKRIWRAGTVCDNLETLDTELVEDMAHHIGPVKQTTLVLGYLARLSQTPAVDADETETQRAREVIVQRDEVADTAEAEEHDHGPAVGLAQVGERDLQRPFGIGTRNEDDPVELG